MYYTDLATARVLLTFVALHYKRGTISKANPLAFSLNLRYTVACALLHVFIGLQRYILLGYGAYLDKSATI